MGCCTPINRCCDKCWQGCLIPTCDFRGCCSFPHGICYTIMGVIMAFGGVFMNMYVIMSCYFMRIVQINPVTGEAVVGSERGYGYLSREVDYGVTPDYRQCLYYPAEEEDVVIDGWWQAGKAFTFMSIILAFVCLCVLLLACCLAFSPSMWERWLLWLYLIAAIFIAFSFLPFGSDYCEDNDCKVAQGGGWSISTFLFFLVAANTVKSMAQALPEYNDDDNDDDDDADDLYYENEADKYRAERARDDLADGDEYYVEDEEEQVITTTAEQPRYNSRQLGPPPPSSNFSLDADDEHAGGAMVPVSVARPTRNIELSESSDERHDLD